MFFCSSTITKSLVAFLGFVILSCSLLPAMCHCHQAASAGSKFQAVPAEHACCKAQNPCKTNSPSIATPAFDNDNCCCKTKQTTQDALLTNSRPDQDLSWESHPDSANISGNTFQYFIDRQAHAVQKIASTFPPTGPPLYISHRALLL
jgi:hypothetical protein